MQVRNLTRGLLIDGDARLCTGIISKFMGLMFTKKQNESLIFAFSKEHKIALHMLFVFYPIDVLFLDKNKVVVDKKESFKPFAFYASKAMAKYAIELAAGAIKKSKTRIGDKIYF